MSEMNKSEDIEDSKDENFVTTSSTQPEINDTKDPDKTAVTKVDQHALQESSSALATQKPSDFQNNPFLPIQEPISGDALSETNDITEEEKVEIKLEREYKMQHVPNIKIGNVDCQEKIILCIDYSDQMFSNHVSSPNMCQQQQVFSAVASAVRRFLLSKSFVNISHQFSLVLMNEEVQLMTGLGSEPIETIQMLQDVWSNKPAVDLHEQSDESLTPLSQTTIGKNDPFDVSLVFKQLEENFDLHLQNENEDNPFTVRVIFVYGRPDSPVKLLGDKKFYNLMMNSPSFFFDCIYIHDKPKTDNNIEEVYKSLCELDSQLESGYILECDLSDGITGIYNAFSRLLAHPLQRQPQSLNFSLELQNQHNTVTAKSNDQQ